ncbi:MAG: 50S ribosomal protein L20, partial [Desulfovibrionaceae bacterium]|nr:50S ribosomal protein L20 [Desulfovibrionaceae bacterium]
MRVKRGLAAHRRHKKFLKMAKGYRGSGRRLYVTARERVEKALVF